MQTPELIRLPKVMAMTGLSRSTIYRYRHTRDPKIAFPDPIKIGERAAAWKKAEVEEWVRKRISFSR